MKNQKYELQIPFESSDNTQDSNSAFGRKIERKPSRKLFQSPKNIFNTSRRDLEVPLTVKRQENMISKEKSMTKSGIVDMEAISKSMRYLSPNSSKSQNVLCNYFQEIKNCEETTSIEDIEGLEFEDLEIPAKGKQKQRNLKQIASKNKIHSSITTKLENPKFIQNELNETKEENKMLLMENEKLKCELKELRSQNKNLEETVSSQTKTIQREEISKIKTKNHIKALEEMLSNKENIITEITHKLLSNTILHQKTEFIEHLFNKIKFDYINLKESNNSLVTQNKKLSKRLKFLNNHIQTDEIQIQNEKLMNCVTSQKLHSNLREAFSEQHANKEINSRNKLILQSSRKDFDIFSLSPE